MSEPWELGVSDARHALDQHELTPTDLLEACLARISAVESTVSAWAFLDPEIPRSHVGSLQDGPLQGIPFGVKDIFNTEDMPTGMGSPVWADFTPGNDARVVFSARRAGSLVVGKTVTAEFAVHTPGPTRNPYDQRRSPGTSSSGSAAAVACGMVPWALGSQTAGSIVRPASYCGIYGFKPSYGTIPRTGMLKTTDTLDQVGFFFRDPEDPVAVFDAIRVSGADYPLVHRSLDRAVSTGPPDCVALVTDSLDAWSHATPEARDALTDYAKSLTEVGVTVQEVTAPPIFNDAYEIHQTIYDRCIAYYFDGEARQHHLVSPVLLEMVDRGRSISLKQYTDALDRQVEMQRAYQRFAAPFGAVLTLATSGPAPLHGDEDIRDSALVWTLCAAPVVALPLFMSSAGLPFGAQLIGTRFHDHSLLELVRRLAERGKAPILKPISPSPTDRS